MRTNKYDQCQTGNYHTTVKLLKEAEYPIEAGFLKQGGYPIEARVPPYDAIIDIIASVS